MKQHLRQELKNVFDAPQPLHKRAFLRALEQPKISIFAFVLTQLGYIRRWVWIVSALVFVLSAAGVAGLPSDTVWVASALMPLLALTVVSESDVHRTMRWRSWRWRHAFRCGVSSWQDWGSWAWRI